MAVPVPSRTTDDRRCSPTTEQFDANLERQQNHHLRAGLKAGREAGGLLSSEFP